MRPPIAKIVGKTHWLTFGGILSSLLIKMATKQENRDKQTPSESKLFANANAALKTREIAAGPRPVNQNGGLSGSGMNSASRTPHAVRMINPGRFQRKKALKKHGIVSASISAGGCQFHVVQIHSHQSSKWSSSAKCSRNDKLCRCWAW